MKIRVRLLVVLVLFSSKILSQTCDCIQKTSPVQATNKADFKYIKAEYNRLLTSQDSRCKAASFEILINYYLNGDEQDFDSVKVNLSRQKGYLLQNLCFKRGWLKYYSNLSQYYFLGENNIEEGVSSLINAIPYAEELEDYEELSLLYSNLAVAFSRLDQLDKMLWYAKKLYEITDKLSDDELRINRLGNVATSYNTYYWATEKKGYEDTVYFIAKDIVEISRGINFWEGLVNGYNLLHNKPYAEKNFQKAMQYLDSAELIINTKPVSRQLQKKYSVYSKKMDVFEELEDYKSAILCSDSLLKFARESGQSNLLFSTYKRRYLAYKYRKDYENAFINSEMYHNLKDSIFNIEKVEKVNELEQRYNKAKNERTINELSQERQIDDLKIKMLAVLVILALLLIVLVIFIYRQRTLKQKQEILIAEQRLNRSRINPHFLFNAMGAMQHILITEENKQKLVQNFSDFTKLMRQTLENSYTEYVTLEKEIEFLNHYMKIQLTRKLNSFTYNYQIDELLDVEDVIVPNMILQPFIENAIEHGFSNIKTGGEIDIIINKEANNLIIIIKDNGKGIGTEVSGLPTNHISRATQITKDRLFLLKKLKKSNAGFEIGINQPNGVIVRIILPLLYKNEVTDN